MTDIVLADRNTLSAEEIRKLEGVGFLVILKEPGRAVEIWRDVRANGHDARTT